ncbi:O-antigen ligase family protein [Microbacterium sp. LRZ72]|uniref:O-antigen ligase family protein n=1 Tax=Microbacterium sp. LRZ72 TaxID=2942481 RepID=UPI0029ABBBA5|nr:O-antigen ligase family protein [Microbacterium sp. LRZ72]MDX2377034.1 O-antigen ligase family protein [Microbacterium sp. LRZ72]
MTDAAGVPRHPVAVWASDALDSAAFARAYTVTAFGAVLSAFAIVRMAGVVTYATVLGGLCVVGAAVLVRRRHELNLVRLVPSTLVLLLAWLLATLVWSVDAGDTVSGWLGVAALAFIAVVIGHIRDTLQTARALGDVLRVLLSVSLGLEILSGILLDVPIRFLSIEGNIAAGGPVQGIFGTRNMLGFVAVIALITFAIEWRTSSIRRGAGVFSVALAGILALFSASPTVLVLALAVAGATGALMLVRRTPAAGRRALQFSIAGIVVVGAIAAYLLRHPIIAVLNAGSDFATRAQLWDTLLIYVRLRPVPGWGWVGPWPQQEFPFVSINFITDGPHASALNAYLDMLLQAGWVGLLLFTAMSAIALVRSWLVASARRSIVYAWTPLVLVTLLADSMFESFTLGGFGWLLLVVCAVRAGMSRSWRERMRAADAAGPDAPSPALPQGPPTPDR